MSEWVKRRSRTNVRVFKRRLFETNVGVFNLLVTRRSVDIYINLYMKRLCFFRLGKVKMLCYFGIG